MTLPTRTLKEIAVDALRNCQGLSVQEKADAVAIAVLREGVARLRQWGEDQATHVLYAMAGEFDALGAQPQRDALEQCEHVHRIWNRRCGHVKGHKGEHFAQGAASWSDNESSLIDAPGAQERTAGPFSRTYMAGGLDLLSKPLCPACGGELNEPVDDEDVAVEWCSTCGERCIVTRKQMAVYTTWIERMDSKEPR